MGKVEKGIILVIIIILIISIILLVLFNIQKKQQEIGNTVTIENQIFYEDYTEEEKEQTQVEPLQDRIYYYTVSNCVSNYLNILNKNNTMYFGYDDSGNYTSIVKEIVKKQNIYDLLSNKYIEENKITKENVYEYVEKIEENVLFVPLEITYFDKGEIGMYAVHGVIETQLDYKMIKEVYYIVTLDRDNNTYSIEPLKQGYQNISEVNLINNGEKIRKNDNNTFRYATVEDATVARDYILTYKRLALGAPDIMYQYLNKEYKQKKFGSLEKFKQYVVKNKQQITKLNANQYKVEKKNDYTQYMVIDDSGNYYIFQETTIKNFTTMLDAYTVDLPEYIAQYETTTEYEKAALCINKCIQAMNLKDYSYIYNQLNNEFKNNYFKNLESFEQYMNKNFPSLYQATYVSNEKNGDIIMQGVELVDKSNTNNAITKTFLIKLKEERNFELSFNIN